MSNACFTPDDMQSLIDAAMNGSITAEQAADLQTLLENDRKACEIYAEYARIEAELHLLTRGRMANQAVCRGIGLQWTYGESISDDESYGTVLPASSTPVPSGGVWQGTIATFSQIGPLSYLIATVILSVMLLGAWAYKINHPDHFVKDQSPAIQQTERQFVGQVTGMKDCRWVDEGAGTMVGASVPLGRKYALISGLLEITYTSGARVILEGPCNYKVNSKIGGYLELGKLTALVETKAEGVRRKAENGSSLDASPFPPPPSTFVVKTPTAVITDLGTEFGVEVKPDESTEIHVFQGQVEAKWSGRGTAAREKVRLSQGEAVAFDGQRLLIEHLPAQPQRFHRIIARSPGKLVDVAAKKTIVKWSGVYRYGDSTKNTSDWTTLERFGAYHVNDGVTDETNAGESYWLGRAYTPDEYFIIYLRGCYLIDRVELMNTHSGPGNDHGTKDFEIWAADEVDSESELLAPRLVLKGTLPCRFGAGPKIPLDVFKADAGDFTPFHARYIKFVAKTYYEGAEMGGCGLNEIKVFATSSSSPNTEPAASSGGKTNKETR